MGSGTDYAIPYQPTSPMAWNSSLITGVKVVTQLVSWPLSVDPNESKARGRSGLRRKITVTMQRICEAMGPIQWIISNTHVSHEELAQEDTCKDDGEPEPLRTVRVLCLFLVQPSSRPCRRRQCHGRSICGVQEGRRLLCHHRCRLFRCRHGRHCGSRR